MNQGEETSDQQPKWCGMKSILIKSNKSQNSSLNDDFVEGRITLYSYEGTPDSFLDILLSDGSGTFLGRILPEGIRGKKQTKQEKLDLAKSYILGDLKHVNISYEMVYSSDHKFYVCMSIKDEFRCCDDEILMRKYWKGNLYVTDDAHCQAMNWPRRKKDERQLCRLSSLFFIKMMEQRMNDLQQKLLSTEEERDNYKRASYEWKDNCDKLTRDGQKSLDELTSNFLILHNNTKKQLREALKQVDVKNSQKENLIIKPEEEKKSYASHVGAQKAYEEAVDHVDEHDLEIFDPNDVEKYALGFAVAKNSVNPKMMPLQISQSQDYGENEPTSVCGASNPPNTQFESQQSFAPTHSCKNPYTGAVEMWDPNALLAQKLLYQP